MNNEVRKIENTNNKQINQESTPNKSLSSIRKKTDKIHFLLKKFSKKISLIEFICAIIILITTITIVASYFNSNTRTIMIYMTGSNLESESGLGTVDLNSIDYNEMDNKNIKVVLIAGGSKEWQNNYINQNETSIYELTSSGYEKVQTQNIKNMGDDQVFSDYLNYVYENYQTDEYDLIFWNHGGAIIGSEFDDLSGDNLSLEEMETGLKNSKFNENNKLETVIFRTCLNGTIEVASVFEDYSNYLVASEEITLGAPIASVLNFVNEIKPLDKGYDISQKFINSYRDQINTLKQYYGSTEYIYSTYSIVDLSQIESLITSLNDFVKDISIDTNYNQIAKVRSNLYQYAYAQGNEPSYDMVDLYNLIYNLKDISPVKANKILKDIEKAVVYNWATNSNSRGISIYFPYNGTAQIQESLLQLYDSFDSLTEYNNFIKTFNNIQNTSTTSYSFNSNKIELTEKENDQADFTLELTESQKEGLARAEYAVFMDKGNGYYWPVYRGKEVEIEGNKLKANINGKHLKVTDDGEEYIITLFETYIDENYIKYNTFATVHDNSAESISDWKIDGVEISFVLDRNEENVKVGSAVLNNANANQTNSVAVNLNDYQYVEFGASSRRLLNEKGEVDMNLYQNSSNGIIEGISLEVSELNNLKLSSFDDENDYYCFFYLYDVNNNVYYSKLVKMK